MTRHLLATTALATCSLFAMASPLSAQTAQSTTPPAPAAETAVETGNDIIVTANRRNENVQNVPASISVLGGTALAKAGITNSNEIAQVAANVTISSTFNNSNPRIFIRGVGSADFNPNAASPVGIYVDDVYIASTNALQFQLFDVQRVEVLRGPQGTLYGRNTTAGAIKYFSNQPTEEFEGNATFRFGNFNDRFAAGAISGTLIKDVVTARISASTEERDGNTVNRLTNERTGNDIRSWGARALVNITPGDDWRISLNLHGGVASPHTVTYKPRGLLTAAGAPCSLSAALSFQCFDVLGYRDSADLYSVANNRVGRERVRTIGGSAQIQKDLGFATLTSISAYDRVKLNREEDSDGGPNQLLEITYAAVSKQFSQELRLTSPGGNKVNWIVGAYYFNEVVNFQNSFDLFRTLRPVTGFDPSIPVANAEQLFDQKDVAIAGFGRVDVALADGLKLTVGGRYTRETKSFNEAVSFVEPTFSVPIFAVGNRAVNSRATGDLILDYQATRDLLLYASISRGFKSGGFNGGIVFDPRQVSSFGPETLTSYETGIKFRTSDHRLTLNTSAFYYDYKDLQVYTLVDIAGSAIPVQTLENASNAVIYGLEGDMSYQVLPELRFRGSLGLLHSRFKNFISATTATDYSGNKLARAPEVTASFGADASVPVSDRYQIEASFDASYRSTVYFDAANDPLTSQDGYILANARLGFGPTDGRWTAALWGKNIFDKHYYRDVVDFKSFGFNDTTVGDPATYGVEVSFKF